MWQWEEKGTHFNRNEPITGRVSARMAIHSSAVKMSGKEKHAEAFTSVWMRAATLCWGNVGLCKPKLRICALLRWNRNSEAGLKCYCELRRFKFPFSGTKISYLLNINIRDMLSFSLLQSELNECICRVLSDTNVCHVSYKQQLDIVSTWLIHRLQARLQRFDNLIFIMISPSSPLNRDVCMSPWEQPSCQDCSSLTAWCLIFN